MVLLHGPGEFGGTWLPVLDDLARTHRVIAPDLPGHGASDAPDGGIDAAYLTAWLGELIDGHLPDAARAGGPRRRGCDRGRVRRGAPRPDHRARPGGHDGARALRAGPTVRAGACTVSSATRPRAPTSGSWTSARSTSTPPGTGSATGGRRSPRTPSSSARDPRVQAATGAMIGLYGASRCRTSCWRRSPCRPRSSGAARTPRSRSRRRGGRRALRLAAAGRGRRRRRPGAGPPARVRRGAARRPRHDGSRS